MRGSRPRSSKRVLEPVAEELAVREAGQRVVERLVGELLLQRVLLGDVAQCEHPAAHGRIVDEVGQRPVGHQLAPVGVAQPEPDLVDAALARVDQPGHDHDVVAPHEGVDPAAEQALRSLAQDPTRGGAHEGRGPVPLEDHDQVGTALDQCRQPPLALVGDVAFDHDPLDSTVPPDQTAVPEEPGRRDRGQHRRSGDGDDEPPARAGRGQVVLQIAVGGGQPRQRRRPRTGDVAADRGQQVRPPSAVLGRHAGLVQGGGGVVEGGEVTLARTGRQQGSDPGEVRFRLTLMGQPVAGVGDQVEQHELDPDDEQHPEGGAENARAGTCVGRHGAPLADRCASGLSTVQVAPGPVMSVSPDIVRSADPPGPQRIRCSADRVCWLERPHVVNRLLVEAAGA